MNGNGLFEKFQSGLRAGHNTETSLLRVFNDLLLAANFDQHTVLLRLDLSVAFDSVNHSFLIERLQNCFGIPGLVLDQFCSYRSGRSFCVKIGNQQSASVPPQYGVPQESILQPLLFSIYMLPLNSSYHFYANDTQLYLSFDTSNTSQLKKLHMCIADINHWMELTFHNSTQTNPRSLSYLHSFFPSCSPLAETLVLSLTTLTSIFILLSNHVFPVENFFFSNLVVFICQRFRNSNAYIHFIPFR